MAGAGEWQALENGRRWRMAGAGEWSALENGLLLAAVKRGSPTNDEGVQPSLMICQKLRPTKCMRDFEPMTLGPHICGALSE
jgi:hypothetical protein